MLKKIIILLFAVNMVCSSSASALTIMCPSPESLKEAARRDMRQIKAEDATFFLPHSLPISSEIGLEFKGVRIYRPAVGGYAFYCLYFVEQHKGDHGVATITSMILPDSRVERWSLNGKSVSSIPSCNSNRVEDCVIVSKDSGFDQVIIADMKVVYGRHELSKLYPENISDSHDSDKLCPKDSPENFAKGLRELIRAAKITSETTLEQLPEKGYQRLKDINRLFSRFTGLTTTQRTNIGLNKEISINDTMCVIDTSRIFAKRIAALAEIIDRSEPEEIQIPDELESDQLQIIVERLCREQERLIMKHMQEKLAKERAGDKGPSVDMIDLTSGSEEPSSCKKDKPSDSSVEERRVKRKEREKHKEKKESRKRKKHHKERTEEQKRKKHHKEKKRKRHKEKRSSRKELESREEESSSRVLKKRRRDSRKKSSSAKVPVEKAKSAGMATDQRRQSARISSSSSAKPQASSSTSTSSTSKIIGSTRFQDIPGFRARFERLQRTIIALADNNGITERQALEKKLTASASILDTLNTYRQTIRSIKLELTGQGYRTRNSISSCTVEELRRELTALEDTMTSVSEVYRDVAESDDRDDVAYWDASDGDTTEIEE